MKKIWILFLFLISLVSCGSNLTGKPMYGKYILSEPLVIKNENGQETTLISRIEVIVPSELNGIYTYANNGGDIIEYRVEENGIDIWQIYDDYYFAISYRNVELKVFNYIK